MSRRKVRTASRRRSWAWLALLCGVLTSSVAPAEPNGAPDGERKRLALLEPTAAELEARERQAIASELGRLLTNAGYEVVRENDVTTLLLMEQKRQTVGATDSGTLARAAELLSARYVVSSEITKLGPDLLIASEMLDAKRGVVINRVTKRSRGLDKLLIELGELSRELLSDSATLVITKQVEGARVWLDERLLGSSPIAPLPLRSFGVHRLHIESDEHAPYDAEFTLHPGRTTRVRLELESIDDLQRAHRQRRIAGIATVAGGAVVAGLSSIGFVEAFAAKRQYDRVDLLLTSQAELDAIARRGTGFLAGGIIAAGVGAALIGIGLYLILYDPHLLALHSNDRNVALLPLPNGAVLVGGF